MANGQWRKVELTLEDEDIQEVITENLENDTAELTHQEKFKVALIESNLLMNATLASTFPMVAEHHGWPEQTRRFQAMKKSLFENFNG